MKLILASSSPFRKSLLERLGFNFSCISPEVDEEKIAKNFTDPHKLAQELAKEKCLKIASNHNESIVIGSDQLLAFDDQVFGKPHTFQKAVEQLMLLSGKEHQLITSVFVYTKIKNYQFTNTTHLTMRKLTVGQIEDYLHADSPFGCAGSYMIEKQGIKLFSKIITDDFNAIIGLPLIELNKILLEIYGLE